MSYSFFSAMLNSCLVTTEFEGRRVVADEGGPRVEAESKAPRGRAGRCET